MSVDLLYSLCLKRHDLFLFCYASQVPSPGGQTQTLLQVTHNKEQSAPVELVVTTVRVPRVDNKKKRGRKKDVVHLFTSQVQYCIIGRHQKIMTGMASFSKQPLIKLFYSPEEAFEAISLIQRNEREPGLLPGNIFL